MAHKVLLALFCSVGVQAARAAQNAEPTSPLPGAALTQKSVHLTDPLTTHDPNLYLLVDDRWVARSNRLVRVMNHPQVLPEPIIWPDDPATERDCAWGNVIREPDGRFRIWYTTMMMGHEGKGAHEMASAGVWGRGADFSFHPRSEADVREVECMLGKYAESTDGIHWVKPKLGLVEFRGDSRNNIVLNAEAAARQTRGALTNFDGFTVVRDDAEPDSNKRYKMIGHWESVHFWDNSPYSGSLGRPAAAMEKYQSARGKYITCSPDGIRWNQPLVRLETVRGGGDRCLVVRDHRHRRWWLNDRPASGYGAAGLATSEDLINWSPTEPHMARANPDHPDIESLIPFNYGNQDLGFLITQVKGKMMLSYLVAHHNGQPWKRIAKVTEEPFIAPGPPGSYYATGGVVLHNEPIIVADQLFIYFNAFAYNQHPLPARGARSIGLAKLRRDGFVGFTVAASKQRNQANQGELLTEPLEVSGRHLYVNVEQRGRGGRLEIALLNPDHTPIPGFGMNEAIPIVKDAVRHPVTWTNAPDVRMLLGRKIRIHVRVTGSAVLYALGFAS